MSINKILFTTGLILFSYGFLKAQDLPAIEQHRVKLPNGWSLTPVGKSLPLGDLPLNIAVSKNRKYAAVTNNGESTQTIQLLDAQNDTQLDSVVISKAWGGLVFSADEKSLYASGGDNNWIIRYAITNNKLISADTIKLGPAWTKKVNSLISPTGLALDDKKGILYVVTKQDNSLYLIDLKTKSIQQKIDLGTEAYTCLLSPDQSKLYISLWGADKVAVFDTKENKLVNAIAVGDNPNDLCLSHNGRFLYVANANDNTVSVIDLPNAKVLETLNTAVRPTMLSGTTSNSVALSKDDKTLYIANADNNCLAVFNVSKPGASQSLGFVPTGWYPSVVRMIGNKLYVANGKGFSSLPNPHGPNPVDKKQIVLLHGGDPGKSAPAQYIGGGLLMGTLSIIQVPTDKELALYSQAVYHNTPFRTEQEMTAGGEANNPIPGKVGDASPIKHVFYIIQENRTYDQVLSDIPKGNGDTSLLLFGRNITPNHHALAENFVLLDNFYVDGEVSADGHNWSMGAYATDYMEKNWPTSYGGRGPGATGETSRNKLYIWDQADRFKVSFRTYGEFVNANNTAQIPVLKDHFPKSYPTHDLRDPDTMRYHAWEHDFDSLMSKNTVPQLMTIRMLSDHTEGTTAGRPTPFAHVADNDLAVGMLIDHLSHTPLWENSVVFVVEDDAQNGPDHVDAHRSPAYIAGGLVKRNFVDHTMYSTSSVLRTIELILGLPPMTQYDAAATPMWNSFTSKLDAAPFKSFPSNINLKEVNPKGTKLAAMAKGLDFSGVDKVPDQIMNSMLWKAIRGENSTVPTPVRAAFVKAVQKADDDD
ncbi:bifunctional YncE family protein/alkaline phosphatase family protein [Mucilaginibacter sp. dw_454]|uniref:bifunctional YncE family protein/alkaline phosphatase family protein n=1 Tax=Mucilaginibacter sp. dw_454 TaxID=2720079 RepID=UPI001BD4A24B|nr:bifunctional YncE family protein/alkaline phosphatase family protein [Mucilaginibacter sp. dw_454]